MGKIGWSLMAGDKEIHEVITTAIRDFKRIGYLVQGIVYKGGTLEVICTYPRETESEEGQSRTFGGV